MTDVSKKISFGFSKSKVSNVKIPAKVPPTSVQYISCFDSNAIVLKKGTRQASHLEEAEPRVPERSSSEVTAATADNPAAASTPVVEGDSQATPQTLEQRAANELLRDAKNFDTREPTDTPQSLVLQIAQAKHRVDSEVSTREDYEQVPVDTFGLALLRGMGWDATRGIGKKPQIVSAAKQVLRPKGVGLGAEKKNVTVNNTPASSRDEEQLKVKVGAFLKITSGLHRDKYGKILGFNEESGRLIVELSNGGTNVSVNESAVQLVTKDKYTKNSRVLNAAKYESYMRGNGTEQDSDDRKSQKRKHESR